MQGISFHQPAITATTLGFALVTAFIRWRLPKVPHYLSSPGVVTGLGLIVISSVSGLSNGTAATLIAALALFAFVVEWYLGKAWTAKQFDPPSEKEHSKADIYNINAFNSGFIGRNEGTVNFQKPPFIMTEAIMQETLGKLDRQQAVSIYSVGGETSDKASILLAKYLAAHGLTVHPINTLNSFSARTIGPNGSSYSDDDGPVTVNGIVPMGGRVEGAIPIVVDASK